MRGRLTSVPMDSLRGVMRGETPRFKFSWRAAPVPRVALGDSHVSPCTLPGARCGRRARVSVETGFSRGQEVAL